MSQQDTQNIIDQVDAIGQVAGQEIGGAKGAAIQNDVTGLAAIASSLVTLPAPSRPIGYALALLALYHLFFPSPAPKPPTAKVS